MDDNDYDFRQGALGLTFTNIALKLTIAFFIMWLSALVLVKITEKEEKTTEGIVSPPGNSMVEIRWPDKVSVDVDLWVQSPDDPRPVGYSNRGGKTFNLLRDDMGSYHDLTPLNYEVVYGRGLPDGEYTVNIHLYSNNARLMEVPVEVVVSVADVTGAKMQQVAARKVILRSEGEEVTVVRFTLRGGKLDPASIHDLPKELRTWQSSSTPSRP